MEEFQLVPEGAGDVGTVYATDTILELRLGRDPQRMKSEQVAGASAKLACVRVDGVHAKVGSFHARIFYDELKEAFFVVGHHKNGTYVDGEELVVGTPQRIKNHAQLQLGAGGPIYRFMLGRGEPVKKTAAVDPEPARTAPANGPAPKKPGSVRCPDCGNSIPRAEVDKHREETGHKIESWSTTDLPEPASRGIVGSTAEFVNRMIPGAGTKTVEMFRGMMDKRVAGKLRLVYVLLALAGLVTGGTVAYSKYKLDQMRDQLQGLAQDSARKMQLAESEIAGLKSAHAEALELAKKLEAVTLPDSMKGAVFSIGVVPEGQSAALNKPGTDVVFGDVSATAFLVSSKGVLVTNAHVAIGLLVFREQQRAKGYQWVGAALRNGRKNDFCRFEVDGLKFDPEYPAVAMKLEEVAQALKDTPPTDEDAIRRLSGQLIALEVRLTELDVAAVATDCAKEREHFKLVPGSRYAAKAARGARIAIVGYPGAVNARAAAGTLDATTTQGFLVNDAGARVVYDAKTGSGFSGSPVFTRDAEVVALHSGSTPGGNYAWSSGVKSPVVLAFLKKHSLLP